MNQLDFAMLQLERDLDRLGIPIDAVFWAPIAVFVVLVVLEKWRHRPPTDVLQRVARERGARARAGDSGVMAALIGGLVVGIAAVLALDLLLPLLER